jgi:hypothetical protein
MCDQTKHDAIKLRRRVIAIIQEKTDETGFVDEHELVDTMTTDDINSAIVEKTVSQVRQRGTIEIKHDGRICPTYQ